MRKDFTRLKRTPNKTKNLSLEHETFKDRAKQAKIQFILYMLKLFRSRPLSRHQ